MALILRLHEAYKRWQNKLLIVLSVIFVLAFGILYRTFYVANTVLVPSIGGTYIEGSVGEMQPLNPWFTVTNDVNRDIVSLVFSGLLKFNPDTKKIESDLADFTVSSDERSYTVTLKENLEWHDSTEEKRHFVTADDVVFTFKSIQDPAFPNPLLRQNFQGVEIEKINERTVRFRLERPYSFFTSNLTLGLIPQKSFEGLPVGKFDQELGFAFAPIGAGPYKFKSLVQTDLSTEVTLERFDRPIEPTFHLQRLVFRIFPNFSTLLSDLRNVDGVRIVPRNEEGKPIISRRFETKDYTLPQYVALFFNLSKPFLQDSKLRLGLQLGTDKQAIIDLINEKLIVDTPLLEINKDDWKYKFDREAAQGALFASDWNLPEKVRLQRLLEQREANMAGHLRVAPLLLLDTGAILTVTGSLTNIVMGTTLNGAATNLHKNETGSWIAVLPTDGGTGSLKLGSNLLRMVNPDGKITDSAYVWRTTDAREFRRAKEEQRLVEAFVKTRDGTIADGEEKITVPSLYLEGGMLRKRLDSDPLEVRINARGEKLSLTLLTSNTPPQYKEIAEELKKQWQTLGVHLNIEIPETREQFEEKLLAREYDILLFGQSLLDNLDSYPYWHSSQAQRLTGNKSDLRIDAYNLSQYSSLRSDTLLEKIRSTNDEKVRQDALQDLQEILKNDVPAVFLYSPLYTFAYVSNIQGIDLKNLSQHSDRYLTLHQWFMKQERQFKPGKSMWSFIPWLFSGASS